MSSLNTLIQKLCPEGIPTEALAAIGQWYGGGTPSKGRPDFWQNGTIPWVSPKDMGRPVVDSTEDYVTEAAIRGSATKLVPPTSIAMVVRSSILDRIFPSALIPVPVALNQDMKAVVPRDGISPRYVAHVLRSQGPAILKSARKTGGSVASIESSKLFAFRIAVPPIEIQEEIVRILDQYSSLEADLGAELHAELQARGAQYTHYRDALFSFTATSGVPQAPMGEVGQFIRGRRFTKNDVVDAGIPSIHYGEIYTYYGTAASTARSHVREELRGQLRYAQPGDVVVAAVGETVEDVGKAVAWLGDEPVAIHDDCFLFRHALSPKFVSYYLQTKAFHSQKARHVARAKVKRLSGEALAKLTIPVPPLPEQERIVAILDAYEKVLADLSASLPAERAVRSKQYEHYRDRLLTFDMTGALDEAVA